MIRKNLHILIIAIVFYGATVGLDAVGFWQKVGLPAPQGYVFQGFLFLAFYFVLSNMFFSPYIAVMHEREERTSGKRRACEATQEKADQLMAKYKGAIEEARLRAIQERELAALRAEDEAKAQVDAARKKASQDLAQAKSALAQEIVSAKQGVDKAAGEVAREIVINAMAGGVKGGTKAVAGAGAN